MNQIYVLKNKYLLFIVCVRYDNFLDGIQQKKKILEFKKARINLCKREREKDIFVIIKGIISPQFEKKKEDNLF